MPSPLRNLADTISPLLEAYHLVPTQLLDGIPEPYRPLLDPIIADQLTTHGVTLEKLVEELERGERITVRDAVAVADELLTGATRATYMSQLRFFADGWHVRPELLSDAVEAADEVELRAGISPDPADHPTVDVAVGNHTETHLLLWPGYGDQPIDTVLRSKIELAVKYKRAAVLTEAARRDRQRAEQGNPPLGWTGAGAARGLLSALAYLYTLMRDDEYVDGDLDPLANIEPPDRGETNRRALEPHELHSLWATVQLYASDPELDVLLLKFHLHTGARLAGAVNLTRDKLDFESQSVKLLQKYRRTTEVPVCRTLLDELDEFARKRGSDETGPVFRVNVTDPETGELRPLTRKHYDTLKQRVWDNLDWAREEGWSIHWTRHHAKATIEGIAGPGAARRFLGHAVNHVTDGYGKAGFKHVAWAVARMTGEPHPEASVPPGMES